MNKKDTIIKMFNDAEWIKLHNGKRSKVLTYDSFFDNGLTPTIEYGEKYNDVIYARTIFNKMGYKVFIGMGMYIHEK